MGELLRVVLLGFIGSRIVFLVVTWLILALVVGPGVPMGSYGFFRVSQIPGVGCQNLIFLVKG